MSPARPDLDEYRRRRACKVKQRVGNQPLQRRSGPQPRSGPPRLPRFGLPCEMRGGGELPGRGQRAAHCRLFRGLEVDARAALASPGAFYRSEDGGFGAHEHFLLDRRDFHHGVFFVRVAERSEDFAGYAEVGMVHVGALGGLRKAESQSAKVVRGHRTPPAGHMFSTALTVHKVNLETPLRNAG